MLSHIPNRPGEITLREMILAVKAISVLSSVRGLPYVSDLMGFLPFAYLMFFTFLDFPCSFSRMIDILKVIDESSSQHRIAVTYLTEERSWVFSSIDQFFDESFFLSMVVVIIS